MPAIILCVIYLLAVAEDIISFHLKSLAIFLRPKIKPDFLNTVFFNVGSVNESLKLRY